MLFAFSYGRCCFLRYQFLLTKALNIILCVSDYYLLNCVLFQDEDMFLINHESANDLPSESLRPYLCTGFDMYLVWEPCTM